MHFCTAYVALAGDDQQVVFRGLYSPISWPEIEVIRQMHGDDAVRQAQPFVRVEQSPRAEKERLGLIYGEMVDKQVYPGRNPTMEMDAAEMNPAPAGTLWLNPITGDVVAISGELAAETKPDIVADPPWKRRKRTPYGTFTSDPAAEPGLPFTPLPDAD